MTTITITVRDDDGNLIDHELQPANPKRPIYVAVGEPGHRSGVWRIWGNPPTTGKSDVFVTARSIARVQKFSLHESGDFRHQWVTADAASRFTSSPDKLSKSLTVGESGRHCFVRWPRVQRIPPSAGRSNLRTSWCCLFRAPRHLRCGDITG